MVSVCMAVYNGEKYIKAQLDSILSQIDKNDECIISDDGSNDNTISIISNINDPRIKLIRNNGKHGARSNTINALKHSKGDIIFLSDQDDVWLPGKYHIMLKALRKFDLVHCDSVVTDDRLSILHSSFFLYYNNGPGIVKNMIKSTYFGSHMAFKRKVLLRALPFPDTVEIGHDLWLGLVAELANMKVKFINQKLMLYRRHSDAFCGQLSGSSRSLLKKVNGRIIMLKYILLWEIKRLRNGRTNNKKTVC